jgi:hypothetical protein
MVILFALFVLSAVFFSRGIRKSPTEKQGAKKPIPLKT